MLGQIEFFITGRLTDGQQRLGRFGIGANTNAQTLREIVEELNLSRERVRQLEAVALKKLRVALAERGEA